MKFPLDKSRRLFIALDNLSLADDERHNKAVELIHQFELDAYKAGMKKAIGIVDRLTNPYLSPENIEEKVVFGMAKDTIVQAILTERDNLKELA